MFRAQSKILVIEDEPTMLSSLVRFLSLSYHVRGATTAQEALTVIAQYQPDERTEDRKYDKPRVNDKMADREHDLCQSW